MKKLPLIASVLLLAALPASAQENGPSWLVRTARNYLQSVTARKKSFDSTYVFQPTLKWMVGVESQMIRVGADLHSAISVTDLRGENPVILDGTMDTGIRNDPYRKLGLAVGYGSLSAGYGVQLGKKDEKRNSYFTLGLNSPSYGARLRYIKVRQQPEGRLEFGDQVLDLNSPFKGEMRNLSVDGFYAFNRRRFVFTAAYNGRILQRRSAGSWLVAAKYLQGDFSLDPKDDIWAGLNHLQRYSTRQISAGGGYSFNWVLLHQDPADPSTAGGLRNLTFNATALCRLSFLNHIQTEQNLGSWMETVRYNGQPALSPVVKGGVCYTWGRLNFLAAIEYDYFGFQGARTEDLAENNYLRTKVSTQGVFYDLTVEGKVRVRF